MAVFSLAGTLPTEITATIANATSLSGMVDLENTTLVGIIMPAAWTAANLTFQVSTDGVTWVDMYDGAGIEKTIVAAVNRYIPTPPAEWIGVRFVKVRSGTAGTPVAQGAERLIKLITKGV